MNPANEKYNKFDKIIIIIITCFKKMKCVLDANLISDSVCWLTWFQI